MRQLASLICASVASASLMLGLAMPAHAARDYRTFFGDSITTGLYVTHWAGTYVARLERHWAPGTYTSIGMPGGTASPAGSQYGPSMVPSVGQIPTQSTLVVVEVGTNDLINGRTHDQFWSDYNTLIALIRKQAPVARLLCLGPWQDPTYVSPTGATLSYYNWMVYSACSTHAIDIANIWVKPDTRGPAGRATDWGAADSFHPNDRGQSLMASQVSSALASGV